MPGRKHSIVIDKDKCIACVACSQVCPTRAIRVRDRLARVKDDLCIDCGSCIPACRYEAVRAMTSSQADLQRFKYTVAIPSLTLFGQFGREVEPAQVLHALRRVGFDATYDFSWMCEMVAGATDAYLSECAGPWPKISVTCPAVVRLVQIRYPDLLAHLVPIETPRELAAKVHRRRLAAEKHLTPEEIGIFFVTPCSAIMNSIVSPVGLDASHLDGAFAISELYGPLLKALKEAPVADTVEPVSARGLRWAMAGGEISGMRNANSMTVRGVEDVTYVFDHIEAGRFQSVDFIEAYICPDGCVSGQLTIAGRYEAQQAVHHHAHRLGTQSTVKEEKVRTLLREHFFDFEAEIRARPVRPLAQDLRQAVALTKEKDALVERLPRKDCGACGAPTCETFAEDVLRGESKLAECVFVRIEELEQALPGKGGTA